MATGTRKKSAAKKPAPKKSPRKTPKKPAARRQTISKPTETKPQAEEPAKPIGQRLFEIADEAFKRTLGRPRAFRTPVDLWTAAMNYFRWAAANPWQKNDTVKAGDHFGQYVTAPVERPLTIDGFCIHAGIDENTFQRYRKGEKYKDFWAVALKIEQIIKQQKFEGAAVGSFNASIIARDLGLADRRELTGRDGKPVNWRVRLVNEVDDEGNPV